MVWQSTYIGRIFCSFPRYVWLFLQNHGICVQMYFHIFKFTSVASCHWIPLTRPLLHSLSIRYFSKLIRSPWAFFASCWTVPAFSASPCIADALAAYTPLWPFNGLILVKSMSFLNWGSRTRPRTPRGGLIRAKQKKKDHLPLPTGNTSTCSLRSCWWPSPHRHAGSRSAWCPSWSQGSSLQSCFKAGQP